MAFPRIAASVLLFASFGFVCAAQTPAPTTSSTYSDLIKPPLETLHETLTSLRFEKWKGGSVRSEAEHNVQTILTDMDQTLPQLMQDADAAPGRVGAALPLVRNVSAVYDVALRVLDASRIAGSSDQASQVQEAVEGLEATNTALYKQVEQAAIAQESHIGDLETRLKTAQAAHPVQQVQAAPVCPAPPVKKAVRRKPKPAAAPTQQPQGNLQQQQQQPSKPQN